MRISDWSSDVCSSDLVERLLAARPAGGHAALFFIDLDGFKMVNDTLGHAAGDLLLACVAGRLREVAMTQIGVASSEAVVGRLAGDEFTLFFPQLPAAETAQRISRAVQYALGERFDVGGQQSALENGRAAWRARVGRD